MKEEERVITSYLWTLDVSSRFPISKTNLSMGWNFCQENDTTMVSKKLIGHYYSNNAIIGNIPQQAQKDILQAWSLRKEIMCNELKSHSCTKFFAGFSC